MNMYPFTIWPPQLIIKQIEEEQRMRTTEHSQLEYAIIPKGSCVSIMGCRITLAEDTKVEGNQANIDYILKDQENFNRGIGLVSEKTE